AHDGAGNLVLSASGLALPGTSSCDTTHAEVVSRAVTRTFDTRNRVKTLRLPDGRGDTDYGHTPDGLLATITADNGGGDRVSTSYS
ncbi:hypothetical protein AB4142_34345, partial [Variovorax sp. 2RAF20]